MKLLTYLMSIYIIILSVIPCNDRIAVSNVYDMAQTEVTTHTKHNTSHSDFCSPLCSCSCCQITIASMKFTRLVKTPKIIEANISKKIQFKENTIKNQLYADIWQPPKIILA